MYIFFIGRPIPLIYTVFGRWISLSWFVACIFSRLSSSILKVADLLDKHPMAPVAPTNHPTRLS